MVVLLLLARAPRAVSAQVKPRFVVDRHLRIDDLGPVEQFDVREA